VANFEIVDPRADATIHSFRAFGYDIGAAIADVVDNSISAEAQTIDIYFHWQGKDSYIWIKDDGQGMDDEKLKIAMRPGSFSPDTERKPKDLGRFGLGLKTASFSQCRILSVKSWTKYSGIAQRFWDLKYVEKENEWRLQFGLGPSATALNLKNGSASGTVVIWEDLDRLTKGQSTEDARSRRKFNDTIAKVEEHLGMTFHRFLTGKNKLTITINGNVVIPWDPFLENDVATQVVAKSEILPLGDKKPATATAYVLPHHSKISDELYKKSGTSRGWTAMQGFYIYREDRLLSSGDWLGLGFKKEDHHKLARICIDLPSALDEEWQIDVKKCTVIPHPSNAVALKRLADATRARACQIYRHRGKTVARGVKNSTYVWDQKKKQGKHFFAINRKHPLIEALLKTKQPTTEEIRNAIRLLEETVPAECIQQVQQEQPDSIAPPFEDDTTKLLELAIATYNSFIKENSKVRSLAMVSNIDPFDRYPEVIQSLREKINAH